LTDLAFDIGVSFHDPGYTSVVAAKKNTHGGARTGAGRKPILKDPKSIKVKFDGEVYDRLAEAATERETSIGALVREAVKAALPKLRRRKKS
jgi:hypothetical protein